MLLIGIVRCWLFKMCMCMNTLSATHTKQYNRSKAELAPGVRCRHMQMKTVVDYVAQ